MNGKSQLISPVLPFVLRLSKDERRVFQQNHKSSLSPFPDQFKICQADRPDDSALVVNAGGDGDQAIVSREK
jgi:hypothetical protein